MDEPLIDRYISQHELRDLFNNGDYWGKVQQGELTTKMKRDNHPSPPRADLPFCTRSQIIEYWREERQRLALVHQYLKPDGTIGGSGRPDPKLLVENGVRYRVLNPEPVGER